MIATRMVAIWAILPHTTEGLEHGLAERPKLLIVGGPNGSGKTTVAMQYAEAEGIPYLGADAIAASLNPEFPATARIEAGRQFILSVDRSISGNQSCVIESTLSGRSFRNNVLKAARHGFSISMVFVFVDSADMCVARVAERVRTGGHDVPEPDIRRRFKRSLHNFWTIYRELADNWVVLYNGGSRLQDVSAGSRHLVTVRDETLHTTFLTLIESDDD